MKFKFSRGIFLIAILTANVETPKNQQMIYQEKLRGATPNTADPIFVLEKVNMNYCTPSSKRIISQNQILFKIVLNTLSSLADTILQLI